MRRLARRVSLRGISRNCESPARASSNFLVRLNPYAALATKARAISRQSLDSRPAQHRQQGMKRNTEGIIAKVATSRLSGSLNSRLPLGLPA